MKWIILLISALILMASEPDFGTYDGTGVVVDLKDSKRIVFGTHAMNVLTLVQHLKSLTV